MQSPINGIKIEKITDGMPRNVAFAGEMSVAPIFFFPYPLKYFTVSTG